MKKRICRYFALLLVWTLLLTSLLAQAFAAVPGQVPRLRLSSATAKAGDTVKLTISMEHNPGLIAMILDLQYDPKQLALVSAEDERLLAGGLFTSNPASIPFVLYWDDSLAAQNNTGNGILATLTFRILSGCEEAEVSVTQRSSSTFNKEMQDVIFRIENGIVRKEKTEQPPVPKKTFKDVKKTDWFYAAVQFVTERGLMNGTSAEQFSPQEFTNRAMIATALWRLAGSPSVDYDMSFQDVPVGKWYTEAIRWAQMTGLVNGYNNDTFGTADEITREQMATILYRYAARMGKATDMNDTLCFSDASKVSAWADKAVRWCVREGFLNGKGNGILDPKGKAKRCEVAAILQRFAEKMGT